MGTRIALHVRNVDGTFEMWTDYRDFYNVRISSLFFVSEFAAMNPNTLFAFLHVFLVCYCHLVFVDDSEISLLIRCP